MKRKVSLGAALHEAAKPKDIAAVSPHDVGKVGAPSREGKKAITGFFDPAVSRQLKHIALEEDSSVQALLGEALNDLFAKRGKSPIA